MLTGFEERVWSQRNAPIPATWGSFEFEDAQLHVPAAHGEKPIALWSFFTGEAEVDRKGSVRLVRLFREEGRSWGAGAWVVPVGHELHRMLAASLRITHARQIAEAVESIPEHA